MHPTIGARFDSTGTCSFTLWAPQAQQVSLELEGQAPLALQALPHGYWQIALDQIEPGTRYRYRLDEQPALPDPASRYQPEGVHGPSAVVKPAAYEWQDDHWIGLPQEKWIVYELHVGTFTPAGTFEAAIERLDELVDLGITVIELMPIAQFPGDRNWGYDGVYPFAAQASYGGPVGLMALVDACHERGLAIILDVVYNHQGPEGNYLSQFGPYFTDRYRTPWGQAINFDGPYSDGVRHFY
ncbi:MAG: alpha-amylase family glycosyl hydrolase, partial [Bacteroidota bacterium]